MLSLESLCSTSASAAHSNLAHEGSRSPDIHARPSRALISKLMKLLLPIQLSTIYSPKRQELLFLLLHYYPVLELSLQIKIKDHFYNFLRTIAPASSQNRAKTSKETTAPTPFEHEVFVWIDACESGFFHRFIRRLLDVLSHQSSGIEEGERFVAVLVEIFRSQIVQLKESRARKREHTAASHSEKSEEDFAQRNRLIAIQDFLHLIGTTSQRLNDKGDLKSRDTGISWLGAIDCVADVGSLSLVNLRLDTEFSCAYMIRQLIAMRAILTDLLSFSSNGTVTLDTHRHYVEIFSEVAERLLLQREKGFYRKSLEEVALVVLMTSAQLLRDRSIVFVAQSALAYFQCYGHKAVVDGLLTTLMQRHSIDYEVHLTHYTSDVGTGDEEFDIDPVLTYHHLLEVERLLAMLVTTLLTYVKHELADVIDALDILCSFLLRQLGCLFEAIQVDLSFPATNITTIDHTSSSAAVLALTNKIFRHLVSILTMSQTIRNTSHSADLIAHAEHLLSSSSALQVTSTHGHTHVTSPFDQIVYYIRDKISLLLQSLQTRHVSHHYVTATSSATTSFRYSNDFDREVILIVLHLLLLSQLGISSEMADLAWLLQELTHFADETDFPPLTQFITRLHVTLLLDFQLTHSMTSMSMALWKTSVKRLLEYLWMRLDGSLGRLFGLMDGDSMLAASQVAYAIQSFDAYCNNLAALVSTALSISKRDKNIGGADVMHVREVDGFCLPFLNLWICFVLRCFAMFESAGRGQCLYFTYRANAMLSVTESCFHVIDKIFQYQQHISSHSSSSSTTSYYEEVSLTSMPAWKWLLRFWLLLDVCDIKFSDLWSQRTRLQTYIRSFSRYTMPLYVGQKTLAESTSIDIMGEYIASDKEILSILSLCSREEVALYSQSCAAVMTNATFDVYFAVVYHIERRRILFNREIRACVVLFIEALSWPNADKRRMAQKMFVDLQNLWIEEMRLELLHSEGDGSAVIFQRLSEQMCSLLHYCFDVREEVRGFCQQSLLALLPLLPSPFLLGKVNLLSRLLNCAFHLESIHEELSTSLQISGNEHTFDVQTGTSTAAVIRAAFTTFISPSEMERRWHGESEVMFSKMPDVIYPRDEKTVLEVLGVNFSLLYVILHRNLQLSELVKREQLKDFLTSHHQRQQHSLNETVLLVQEYLNQRVRVTIHTNAARQVHQVRQRAKQAATAQLVLTTTKGNEEVVTANRDINIIFPEASKSAESTMFVTEQTTFKIERSVAQSLFSTRSSLRKQLRQLFATPLSVRGSVSERERALQGQKLYDLLVAYRTIVFHHHPSHQETVALDKKDFLFFLHIASRFVIEQNRSVTHFEDVIDSLDRLVTHYPLYRANVLSIVLASLQTSLFSTGFNYLSHQEIAASELHQQRSCQQQDFSRIIEFLRRMLQLRDAAIADIIRQFVQRLLTHSLHHLNAASSSPDVIQSSVLTSYSNLYAITALALSILQHSATSMAEEGEQLHLLHLLDSTTHAYRITVRHHSLLREKALTLLLTILQTQLDRGDSLSDSLVSLQQQYLLEAMHYLSIDSRRWRLEQMPGHLQSPLPSVGIVEGEEATTEMTENVAMMSGLFPLSLFSLPFTTSARFHHSRVSHSLASSVVLTLSERIQAASLCGRRHGLEEGKEEGEDDHIHLYSFESWRNMMSSPPALARLSGVSATLTLLYSHLLDRYQASATSYCASSNTSSPRGLKLQLPELTSAVFTAIHCNESLISQSMKTCWMTSARLTSLLYRLSFDKAVQQQRLRQFGPSAFASFLSLSAIHHPLFNWSADHFLGCVEALTSAETSSDALRSVLDTLPATSRLSEIFTVLARRQHTSATTTSSLETEALLRLPQLLRYFLRSIEQMPLTQVSFYLPQLVQSLRRDFSCHLTHAIALLAETSPQLCHEVTWCLSTESKQLMRRPNHYGFCFELQGIDPLPGIARALQSDVMQRLSELDQRFLVEEVSFFDAITRISGDLKEVKDKEQHPRVIREYLTQLRDPNPSKLSLSKLNLNKLVNMNMPIYMPTRPGRRVLAIDYDSAAPMQSAAKCPFLLRFVTEDWEGPDAYLRSLLLGSADDGSDGEHDEEGGEEVITEKWRRGGVESQRNVNALPPSTPTTSSVYFADDRKELHDDTDEEFTRVVARSKRPLPIRAALSPAPVTFRTPRSAKVPPKPAYASSAARVEKKRKEKKTTHFDACIFKVYDDCRQDILTLQVVRLLQQYYDVIRLPVFLAPYSIISNRTGENGAIGGILQVIPSVHSRDQLGKSGFKTLKQYYVTQFGPPSSSAYQKAIKAFIASLAAYNVVCYLMHIKDRHNGNILIDTDGHVIHIDFGFILGISPGGNLGFETAAFKFSHEMLELLGGEGSEGFTALQTLTVQAFLAARQIKESILALVNAFADSDLPCFQFRKDALERLYEKFLPSLSESEAAEKMTALIRDAMNNPTTSIYDGIQKLQNNIYSAEWK